MRDGISPEERSEGPGAPWRAARVLVVLGAYGSGKSEVAVNLALLLRRERNEVTLVDLDTINPYFRSSDARRVLDDAGVRTIAPSTAGTNVDVPAVPAEVLSVFEGSGTAVLDIGGEDMGARIVSSFRRKLTSPDVFVLMVVNINRPFTSDAARVASMASALSAAAGLPIDAYVDNTNLLEATDGGMLLDSTPILREAVLRSGIPLAFACGLDELLPKEWVDGLPDGTPLIRMKRVLRYPYEDSEGVR
jgi:energy-coupling factor transporter ATP-binding protein EcfA2